MKHTNFFDHRRAMFNWLSARIWSRAPKLATSHRRS